MSTSLLYHGFGLRGYRCLRTDYINGHVCFTVEMKPDQIRCSICDSRLSNFRRQLYSQIEEPAKKQAIKGTRWLLLKNPENLSPDRSEPDRLKAALELNAPLAAAYYMKEDLRQAWNQPDKKTATSFLEEWVFRAGHSTIPMLVKMAHTIATHLNGILAYHDHPISTGPLEGTNNIIKTMKRQKKLCH